MIDYGWVKPGRTLYIPFNTYSSDDPAASITITGFIVGDIDIYKDGNTAQRASTSGYTLLDTTGVDFDGRTGLHGFSINLADNTTAGFYAAGSEYWVSVSSVVVDGATVRFIAATFRIGFEAAVLNTTIATLASQTSFTLTDGPAEDDALNGCSVYIHDVASAVQGGYAIVQDYTGSSKTVTLVAGTTFTAAATDNIAVFPPALQPTAWGRTLDVSAAGEAGIDWANIGGPTTAQNLSGTNIKTDQVVASVSGAVGSVTGAVGSVAAGGIAASSFAAGAINAAAIAADAIGASELAADAVAEIQSGLSTLTAAQVNAEVVDALAVDTYAEPAQGAPAATATLATKIGFQYKSWRNRVTQTSTTYSLFNDDAVTVDHKSTLSDDGTTFVKGEIATGP